MVRQSREYKVSRIFFFLALLTVLALLGAHTRAARIEVSTAPSEMAEWIVAQSADTYIAYDPQTQTWEIGNAGIRRRMKYDRAEGYRLISLTNAHSGVNWASASVASTELRLGIGGQVITSRDGALTLHGYTTHTHADGSLELQVSLARGPLVAILHYVVFPWVGVIEEWVSFENTSREASSNLSVFQLFSLSLRPSPESLTFTWVQGLDPQIEDVDKSQPLPVLRLRTLTLDEGVSQEVGSNARSSEGSMGWFALISPALHEGLFGGIKWSGAWRLGVSRTHGETAMEAAIDNVRSALKPGESIETPRRFLGFFQGDLDDAANASHAFARTYLLRPMPADFPWTQYNTWYVYGIALDEVEVRRQVDAAAELGLELFYVDAGWYEGSPMEGDFAWGLGTWTENREKFPSGLKALSEYVHEKGLKFGLWVEPERVDLRYVGQDKKIPWAWLSPDAGWRPVAYSDNAPTAQVCLGNSAAREWMKGWLTRLVRDYDLDWLKWDNNLWMSCNPPGQTGDGDYAHIQGLYEVLDYLRTEFPDLVVENCASGGNRMDYALMRRTDVAWLSDESDPSYRVRYHLAGASYPFPPEYLNTWLVDSPVESLSVTADAATWRAWLRSRMMGAFGISTNIADWDPELSLTAAKEIAQYKEYRRIIANGRLYRLLPQTELTFPDLQAPDQSDAAEFFSAADDTGVVFLFQGAIPWQSRRLRLKGLNPDALYQITSADRTMSLRRTGNQLMTQGIRFRYEATHPSTLLFIQPAQLGAPVDPTVIP